MFALVALVAWAAPPSFAAQVPADTTCVAGRGSSEAAAAADSPPDSVSFRVGGYFVKVCYSRPLARRTQGMIGSPDLPYGRIWRTGGHAPAVIHTTTPVVIAGIAVSPGSYLLYTVPGEEQWEVVVNRSTRRWADGAGYDAVLRSQEVGRTSVPAEQVNQYVQRLTFRPLPAAPHTILFLEWERVQVAIPISPG